MEFYELKEMTQLCKSALILKQDEWAYLHCDYNNFIIRLKFCDTNYNDLKDEDVYDDIEYECNDTELNILASYKFSNIEIYNYTDLDCTFENCFPYRFVYNNILTTLGDSSVNTTVAFSECGIIGHVEYEWNDCIYCHDDSKCFGFYILIYNCPDILKLIKVLYVKDESLTKIMEASTLSMDNDEFNIDLYSNIPILPSNTKTRRLGYLKLLLQMLEIYKRVNLSIMSRKFEQYCADKDERLHELDQIKGNVIITKSGASAQPYIDIALKLGLISVQNNVVEFGKVGKIYLSLKSIFNYDDTNPFVLTVFDKVFFYELIMKSDYLFISTLLEEFKVNKKYSFNEIKEYFYNNLLYKFSTHSDFFNYIGATVPQTVREIHKRIEEWKKPEVYLKHVLYPRLNRLYELGFISMTNDNTFQINKRGEALSYYIAELEGIYVQPMSIDIVLSKYGMAIANKLYGIQARNFNKNDDFCILEEYINESFDIFRTIAPNRTTFSMLSSYVRYKFLFKNFIIIEEDECIKYLENSDNYIIKLQKQYKDGYVQKK